MKTALVLAAWFGLILVGFWKVEMQYLLPRGSTRIGTEPSEVPARRRIIRMVVAWNPECPCCQFEEEHLRQLARQYPGLDMKFLIQDTNFQAVGAWKAENLPGQASLDPKGIEAKRLGMAATPGCVLFGADGRAAYAGSIHAGRFCDSDEAAFASRALDDLTHDRQVRTPEIPFYGCSI